MSNEIQNPNFKYLTFGYLSFICHFDFVIWILGYWFLVFRFSGAAADKTSYPA